jgi:phage baseplate assembly protein W
VADTPTAIGYGTDLSCGFTGDGGIIDCDEAFTEVDPNSTVAVEQYIARFLSTPQGKIINDEEALVAVGEDPNWGYNLIQVLSQGLDPTTIQAHSELAANALMDSDDRIATCEITQIATKVDGLDALAIYVYGELRTGQSYELVMPLTSDNLETVTDA